MRSPGKGPAPPGQLELFNHPGDQRGLTHTAFLAPEPSPGRENVLVGGSDPGECPVGCRGTGGCLCGQGELSDNPLWVEND